MDGIAFENSVFVESDHASTESGTSSGSSTFLSPGDEQYYAEAPPKTPETPKPPPESPKDETTPKKTETREKAVQSMEVDEPDNIMPARPRSKSKSKSSPAKKTSGGKVGKPKKNKTLKLTQAEIRAIKAMAMGTKKSSVSKKTSGKKDAKKSASKKPATKKAAKPKRAAKPKKSTKK